MMKKTLLAVAVLSTALMTGWAMADDKNAVDAELTKKLADKLSPLFGAEPDAVNKTPVAGVYQVIFGMELVYVSEDGRYIFSGAMIDGETRTDLGEQALTGARKAVMDTADAEKAITYKAEGKEKHVISVFTDVSCPFCVKLHNEVPELNKNGVTVRYYAYPRAGVGSGPYKEMVNAWCSEDPVQALTDTKNGKSVDAKDCENPVSEHFALGRKVGVSGTPAIITDGGHMIPGYRPAKALLQTLEDMSGSS